jgi:hypothetical protein
MIANFAIAFRKLTGKKEANELRVSNAYPRDTGYQFRSIPGRLKAPGEVFSHEEALVISSPMGRVHNNPT